MCRWIAYFGPPVPLESFLFAPEYSLAEQSLHARKGHTTVNGDGFGVGWYGVRSEPGVYRDVRPAWGNENLRNIARAVDSGLFGKISFYQSLAALALSVVAVQVHDKSTG